MGLTRAQAKDIRNSLDNCKRPLYLFDDDPDGLCAFLLAYRYKKEGKGIVVKAHPYIGEPFVRKVREYEPDAIFILDIANVDQQFIDEVKLPVVWIDHHGPHKRERVSYYNPRCEKQDDNYPTTPMLYQVVSQDIWIATVGAVADWFIPPYLKEFIRQYPNILDKPSNEPGKLLFETRLGRLCRMFSFALKGKAEDVNKNIKVLTRIDDPEDILSKKTPQGRFIHRYAEKVNVLYDELMADTLNSSVRKNMVIYKYTDRMMSLTADLSNELLHRFPDKVIIIAREKAGEMKMSLRSKHHTIPPILEKALAGCHNAHGGGHEHACGACVRKEDFDEFVERVEKNLG